MNEPERICLLNDVRLILPMINIDKGIISETINVFTISIFYDALL